MLKVTLKDGSIKEVEEGSLLVNLSKEIGVKGAIVAKVNGKLVDLKDPITSDCSVEFIMPEDKEAFEVINHSCAHLTAQAVQRLYPGTRCGVGPAIEEGYYYDLSIPENISDSDLIKIENEMRKIVKENLPIKLVLFTATGSV